MRLAIVQCGGKKIWQNESNLGPTFAKDAYTSHYFQLNRAYAERFADQWVILSAKYGYLWPDDKIEDYNVTFKRKGSGPICVERLQEQVREKDLARFDEIIVLGGKEYRGMILGSFQAFDVKITDPFLGLQIGKRLSALKMALYD
jgi:hypothetical protein